jgi:hypothetical protein
VLRYQTSHTFGSGNYKTLAQLTTRAVELSNEINMKERILADVKKSCDRKATALCFLGSGVTIAQLAFIAAGTFHFSSWDIMEPICYLMTFGNFTCAYFFYLFQKQDLDLDNIHSILSFRMLQKRSKHVGIDLDDLEALKQELDGIQLKIEKAQHII